MTIRVTSATMLAHQQANLQASMARLAREQDRSSSQKAITRPSDDPIGTATSMMLRAQKASNAQYERNITDGNGWLTAEDSALQDAVTLVRSIRDLTLQGANDGSMSPAAKQAIADQLLATKHSLLTVANTKYLGRSVFAGSSDQPTAYDPTTFAFSGVAGSTVERRIGDAQTVRVDLDGSAIFGDGQNSIFAKIDSIAADLTSGVNVSGHLDDLDETMTALHTAQSTLGTRQNTMKVATNSLEDEKLSLESQRAAVEDVDTAQAALDLKQAENVYQAALLVTAKTLTHNLTDFLR